jgi:hypothetical protein
MDALYQLSYVGTWLRIVAPQRRCRPEQGRVRPAHGASFHLDRSERGAGAALRASSWIDQNL